MSETMNGGSAATAVLETPAASPPAIAAPAAPAPVAPTPAPTTDAGHETWTVPLAKIDVEGSPFRFRRVVKADAKIRELAESIDREGLLNPLTVRRVGEFFQLVSGFRRHAAMAYLARTKGIAPSAFPVKVTVLADGTTDDEALRVSFAENLARKSLDATEKAIAVVKLRDEFGKTQEEIGELVGISRAQITRFLGVLSAPDDVRDAFRSGKFSVKHALVLARVADPAAREALIRKADTMRLRGIEEAGAAPDARTAALRVAEARVAADDLSSKLPETVRSFARATPTGDPGFPIRIVVRLKSAEHLERLGRYLVRLA